MFGIICKHFGHNWRYSPWMRKYYCRICSGVSYYNDKWRIK